MQYLRKRTEAMGGPLPARKTNYPAVTAPARRYLVKEMFGPTLQGEGAHAGRAIEQPGKLGAGEIRIEQQPGPGRE